MPKGERREPRKMSDAENVLWDMNASIFNMRSVEDTTNWDNISMEFRDREFPTIDDFKIKMTQALEAVSWRDKGFPNRMIQLLDNKIQVIKAQQEKPE